MAQNKTLDYFKEAFYEPSSKSYQTTWGQVEMSHTETVIDSKSKEFKANIVFVRVTSLWNLFRPCLLKDLNKFFFWFLYLTIDASYKPGSLTLCLPLLNVYCVMFLADVVIPESSEAFVKLTEQTLRSFSGRQQQNPACQSSGPESRDAPIFCLRYGRLGFNITYRHQI